MDSIDKKLDLIIELINNTASKIDKVLKKIPDLDFDEESYLMMNPDVAKAVANGTYSSGYDHYVKCGKKEKRQPRFALTKEEIDAKIGILINSQEWPAAVYKAELCDPNDELDKKGRAEGIIDFLSEYAPIEGKKFLDFGCGEGHVSQVAFEKKASLVVGYDIIKNNVNNWRSNLLTTDFEAVKAKGPYDVILLYDVMDHLSVSPVDVLKNIKSVLVPQGMVIMRCHPWYARHGSHLYYQINKAFINIFLNSEDLLGKYNYTLPLQLPEYENWIKEAGFRVKNVNKVESYVEPFFETMLLRSKFANVIGNNYRDLIKVSFIDYILS